MNNKGLLAVAPLFLVLAIDSMGLGIIFPILSSMIIDPRSVFLAASTSTFQREFLYGLIIGIYMIAWFFGAAILGDLSDIIGRKKSLLICLLGACIGYFISGIAFYLHSVSILLLGRIIAGFTAGSQPIAQAAIIDVSTEENKARNIGYILLAVSLGFVLGPLAGGILSTNSFASWFNYATPMFFAALFSLFNAVLLLLFFSETFVITRMIQVRLHYAIQIFIEAFQHKGIRWLSLVLLIFISGWGEYFGFISQFLLRRYQYSSLEISLFMVALGIGFSIGFAFLVDFCASRFNLKRCICFNLLIAALVCLITLISHTPIIAWIGSIIIGLAISIAYSILITMFSNQVTNSEQGWVMGVTNAIMALSFGITTFFSGFAADITPGMPIFLAFIGILISTILMYFAKV
ncbi:MAG: hypothetical protein A3E87_00475 [Gammaproteobacteria bacterium RIFCSPHIGHO2_12_FULL_35_23]|nr:MAG: hypothetical protein A3E87_00475 [Gammaproteobacteria bacterium RIFCSPHIGHO2_12_FULL_35_23]